MHKVLRSRVQVDVLLLCFLLGPQTIQLVSTAVTSTIPEPAHDFQRVENHKLNIREHSHYQHRFDQRSCYIDIPVLPKVRVLILYRNELEDRVFQIGIGEKQNHSCVDK